MGDNRRASSLKLVTLTAVIAASSLAAWCDSPAGLKHDTHVASFARVWKTQYATVAGSCPPGTLYCFELLPDAGSFTGTLDFIGADSVELHADGSTFEGSISTTDSVRAFLKKSPYCDGFRLTWKNGSAGNAGTWTQSYDCHGLARGGTYIAP